MVTINNSIEQRVRKAVRILDDQQAVVAVYIFGSQANGNPLGTPCLQLGKRGKPDKWSDIDVAVFIEGAEKMGLHRRAQLSAMIQREVGDDLELHFFTRDMFNHPPPASFARFVMANGIHLV